MNRPVTDRLLDLCEQRSEEIAKRWYQDVRKNPRTPSYHAAPEERFSSQVASSYKNLKQMYFAKNPYEEVSKFLKKKQYVEVTCAEGIPLQEAIYALILMRRHIWLYSELQGLVSTTAIDMYQMVESINRIVLLFDYATYTVIQQYQEQLGQS